MIAVTGASGHLGQWVVARLTAIVQKKLEGDPPTVPVLEWSGLQ